MTRVRSSANLVHQRRAHYGSNASSRRWHRVTRNYNRGQSPQLLSISGSVHLAFGSVPLNILTMLSLPMQSLLDVKGKVFPHSCVAINVMLGEVGSNCHSVCIRSNICLFMTNTRISNQTVRCLVFCCKQPAHNMFI